MHMLTYFQLLTALSDIQFAVNCRPLTYRFSDNELNAIASNSFLRFHGNASLFLKQADDNSV